MTTGIMRLAVFAFAARVLYCQFDTGAVLGSVQDAQERAVAGATLTLISVDRGIKVAATSDDDGAYQFLSVPAGEYEIAVAGDGMQPARSERFRLTVGSRQRVDFKLQPAGVQTTLDVTAVAPLLETESSDRSQVINSRQIVELPLNGRAASELIFLSPGVQRTALSEGTAANVREGSFSANGLRSTFNNFLLDGVDNNYYGTSNQGFSNQVAQLPPDAVAEYKVTTNNMSAEFGRSGGATINAAMRSGTNEMHGAVWHFFRNTQLNAAGFFRPPDNRKPQLNRNQFGFAIGGPVVRNRTFFFADYEGFREINSQVQFANVPFAPFRAGFIGVGALPGGANYPLRNPFTGAIYANGVIPQSDITPYARRVLQELPLPTEANSPLVNNYRRLVRTSNTRDKGDLKFDHLFSDRWRGFARYSQSRADIFDPGTIPGWAGGDGNGFTRIPIRQIAGGVTWARNASTLLEFRFGYSKAESGKDPVLRGGASVQDLLGVPGLPTDSRYTGGITSIVIPGVFPPTFLGRQATNPQYQHPEVWNPKFNFSKILGRHSLKSGFEGQWINVEQFDVNPILGRDIYFGLFSEVPGFPVPAASNPSLTALVSLADFLLGARSTYQITNPVIVNGRQRAWFAYLQDDWKASSRLTLNLGLRYEFATPYFERDNKLSNWDPGANAMVSASGGSLKDRALVNPDTNNFGPRVGLAYQAAAKTAIRSGYGISYSHWNRTGSSYLSLNGPHVVWATVNQAPGFPGYRRAQDGFPADLGSPASFDPVNATVQYMPRGIPTPMVQSWYFSVQREVGRDWLVDLAYVGNRSDDLLAFNDVNQARPSRPGERLLVQQRRSNTRFASIVGHLPIGFSRYHGLQAKVEKRYSAGLYLLNAFTWSKAIDNVGQALDGGLTEPVVQDVNNPANDRGPATFDRTFVNSLSVVYDLPFARKNPVVGGWQISAIWNLRSGAPFSITYDPTNFQEVVPILPLTGRNPYRADVSGDPSVPAGQRSVDKWLDRARVEIPPQDRPFGNSGRNIVRGPSFSGLDLGLFKRFAITERVGLQFRAELFNAPNTTNLGLPNANASSAGFGTIRTAFDPRQVQFALKLQF